LKALRGGEKEEEKNKKNKNKNNKEEEEEEEGVLHLPCKVRFPFPPFATKAN
jgi:hypothetical protein